MLVGGAAGALRVLDSAWQSGLFAPPARVHRRLVLPDRAVALPADHTDECEQELPEQEQDEEGRADHRGESDGQEERAECNDGGLHGLPPISVVTQLTRRASSM